MKQEIPVNEAIKRGHIIVNLPVFVSIFGTPLFAFYLYNQGLVPQWTIFLGFVLGFVIAWLVWSFMITKWRIWAFENVKNVHELKKRAIQEKLIWDDGHFFEKTELRTSEDKDKLKILEKKFEKEDVYDEDYSLPAKTQVYYSKPLAIYNLIVSILIIVIGVYLLTEGSQVFGGIFSVYGLYSFVNKMQKLTDRQPQITINDKGIKTKENGFTSWKHIEKEEVVYVSYGRSSEMYLTYCYGNDLFDKVDIKDLDINFRKLEHLLKTYRLRFNKKHKKNI